MWFQEDHVKAKMLQKKTLMEKKDLELEALTLLLLSNKSELLQTLVVAARFLCYNTFALPVQA